MAFRITASVELILKSCSLTRAELGEGRRLEDFEAVVRSSHSDLKKPAVKFGEAHAFWRHSHVLRQALICQWLCRLQQVAKSPLTEHFVQ
jgi:hypothetical protein